MARVDGIEQTGEVQKIKLIPKSGVASSAGNNQIIIPSTGKKLRLHYVAYNPSDPVECAFRFGASGDLWLRFNIAVANSIIMKDLSDPEKFLESAVNESLYLNLSGAVPTIWNVFYEEVNP